MIKNFKNISYILVVGIFIFCYWYFSYMSIDNQTKRTQGKEITVWYFAGISIEKKGIEEYRSNDGKKMMENSAKAKYGLGNDWTFLFEKLETKEIDTYSRIIDTSVGFKNENNGEEKYFYNRYYYDMNTDWPIVLLEENTLKTSYKENGIAKDKYGSGTIKTLWNGDFDAICIKPNE